MVLSMSAIIFCSCSGHSGHGSHDGHDHDHDHSHEHPAATHEEDSHHDEIFFDDHRAAECGVVVGTVQSSPFARVIRVSGRLASTNDGEASVVATSSGVVELSRLLAEGTGVKAGERLVTIDPSPIDGGDAFARAKADYDVAKEEFERISKLYEEKIVTQGDYNAAYAEYQRASIAYEPFRSTVSGSKRVVSSPMNGFVRKCLVKDGDYVAAGQLLLTVAKSDRLLLVADVPQRHAAALGAVESANFRTASSDAVYSTSDLGGHLVAVGKSVGGGSFYIPVTFSIMNAPGLVEGSYAEIYLKCNPVAEAITLPLSALVEEQGTYFVYKQVSDEHYEKQEVTLGGSDGMSVEVTGGLAVGDEVVMSGAYQIKLASTSSTIPGHTHSH